MAGENLPYDGARYGREQFAQGTMPRHRHDFGYMCLVLRGHFVEAGDAGRFRLAPGDVLVHHPFEAHLDLLAAGGAEFLNLPLPQAATPPGRFRLADPDAIARLAEHDPFAAAEAAVAGWTQAPGEADWPDLLARDLAALRPLSITRWASRHGLAAATVSRGFRQAYGTTPARFRAELRARYAWSRLAAVDVPLVQLALEMGFADQAHMTRSVRALTGAPPVRWRNRVNSVQDAA